MRIGLQRESNFRTKRKLWGTSETGRGAMDVHVEEMAERRMEMEARVVALTRKWVIRKEGNVIFEIVDKSIACRRVDVAYLLTLRVDVAYYELYNLASAKKMRVQIQHCTYGMHQAVNEEEEVEADDEGGGVKWKKSNMD